MIYRVFKKKRGIYSVMGPYMPLMDTGYLNEYDAFVISKLMAGFQPGVRFCEFHLSDNLCSCAVFVQKHVLTSAISS